MAILKVKLARNLRRSIMRGHPWVYREALASAPKVERAQLCQISDAKGEIAWSIYDPSSPLAVRILSHDREAPNAGFFEKRFARALSLRAPLRSSETDCFRLFNGEGDLVPGLVCDIYGPTAIVQFDGRGPGEFWDRDLLSNWLLKNVGVKSVLEKARRGFETSDDGAAKQAVQVLGGIDSPPELVVRENGARFKVDFHAGQKTGFFLDQRDNRYFVRGVSRAKRVLNLFSYSGGFSINAGLGGASRVVSVDISKSAIALAEENWRINGLESDSHQGVSADAFEFLNSEKEPWSHIIVDPPSMAHSEEQKTAAIGKYTELFAAAAKRVVGSGQLSLSSCSSHISFEDFSSIAIEALSQARRRGQILRISGQGPDHPFPHSMHELRYLKFIHLVLD